MSKRKRLNLSALAVVCMLLCGYNALAGPVPDTGDPSERTCNPHSYTDLGNGIIKDNVTGLMWQKATAPGTYTWQQAVDYCNNLSLGGYTDWYLPTIMELSTLVDSSISSPGPTINTNYFPDTVVSDYWSSTVFAGSTSNAWIVYFYYGPVGAFNKANSYYVRAVRSGQ
ncbi:MAG: DUF1566 domain-containing protein [Deltaproteobacteria bacterium]|nr:DUF1566 domain-containing protein [Deltaproteobacteria bacterium]